MENKNKKPLVFISLLLIVLFVIGNGTLSNPYKVAQ